MSVERESTSRKARTISLFFVIFSGFLIFLFRFLVFVGYFGSPQNNIFCWYYLLFKGLHWKLLLIFLYKKLSESSEIFFWFYSDKCRIVATYRYSWFWCRLVLTMWNEDRIFVYKIRKRKIGNLNVCLSFRINLNKSIIFKVTWS